MQSLKYFQLAQKEIEINKFGKLTFPKDDLLAMKMAAVIYSLTGGHPFFTRHLCSFVSQRYPERPLTVSIKMVAGLVEQYLEYAGRDFQEIMDRFSRDYPEERDACIAIVQNGGTILLSELTKASNKKINLRHLLGYQIIQMDGDKVCFVKALLAQYSRNQSADLKINC